MKFSQPVLVSDLVQLYGVRIVGNEIAQATGINELHKVQTGDISFVDHEKYYGKALNSNASIIIIDKEVDCPPGKTLLIHENPFLIYDRIVRKHRPFRPLNSQIHPSTQVHPSAILEPNVVIGPNCIIGANSYIQANVTIHEHTIIGKHVNIHSGTVIGTDAFYYKKLPEGYKKWRSCGRVVIHDHVEIGAACTINRGVSGDTIIGEGTKLDCQVHLGHGVVIGKNCLLAAQVGIGGKTIIGDDVILYGQVGVAQSIRVGDGVTALGQAGITKSVKGQKVYTGTPIREARLLYKELAALRQLPGMLKMLFRKKEE